MTARVRMVVPRRSLHKCNVPVMKMSMAIVAVKNATILALEWLKDYKHRGYGSKNYYPSVIMRATKTVAWSFTNEGRHLKEQIVSF